MFDFLRFEAPYPPSLLEYLSVEELTEIDANEGTRFQTKSLDRNLDCYTITAKGRLIRQHQSAEAVPAKDRPYYKTPQWNVKDKKLRAFYRTAGSMKPILLEAVDTEHHGYLHFYCYRKKKMVEFRAKFTDGQLVTIRLLKDLT